MFQWDQIHRFQIAQRREWIWSLFLHSMEFEERRSTHWKSFQVHNAFLFFWSTCDEFLSPSASFKNLVGDIIPSKFRYTQLWYRFKRPFIKRFCMKKVVWTLMWSAQVCAPELGFERIQTSDTTKVKVWCILRWIESFEGENWIHWKISDIL